MVRIVVAVVEASVTKTAAEDFAMARMDDYQSALRRSMVYC